jgi:hypothetical protein
MISARMDELRPAPEKAKPKLRVVTAPKPSLFDSITRESVLKRVRFLRDRWHMQCLVDQATFNVPNLDCLEDADLVQLLHDMERARECRGEGIDWEEAGLIRSVAHHVPLDSFDWAQTAPKTSKKSPCQAPFIGACGILPHIRKKTC